MCALPRATAVTTVYQRDSSSKRPRASVVSAVRHRRVGVPLSRAPRRWRRPWTRPTMRWDALMWGSWRLLGNCPCQEPSNARALTKGHSISV